MSAYREALNAVGKVGVSRASDEQLMALFCDTSIQITCGAVSPQLVWEGAQKKGLTTNELVKLAHTDPGAVADLMWI